MAENDKPNVAQDQVVESSQPQDSGISTDVRDELEQSAIEESASQSEGPWDKGKNGGLPTVSDSFVAQNLSADGKTFEFHPKPVEGPGGLYGDKINLGLSFQRFTAPEAPVAPGQRAPERPAAPEPEGVNETAPEAPVVGDNITVPSDVKPQGTDETKPAEVRQKPEYTAADVAQSEKQLMDRMQSLYGNTPEGKKEFAEFQKNYNDMKQEMSKRPDALQQMGEINDALNKIAGADVNALKGTDGKPIYNQKDLTQIAEGVVRTIANPSAENNQGHNNTCALESIITSTATFNPADHARVTAELTTTGQATAVGADGKLGTADDLTIKADRDSLRLDGEADVNGSTSKSGARAADHQIVSAWLGQMSAHDLQQNASPELLSKLGVSAELQKKLADGSAQMVYKDLGRDGDGTGERIGVAYTDKNGKPQFQEIRDPESGEALRSPFTTAPVIGLMNQHLFGNEVGSGLMIVSADAVSGKTPAEREAAIKQLEAAGVAVARSPEDLMDKMARNEKLGIASQISMYPGQVEGVAGSGGGHSVNARLVNGQVYFDNHWGEKLEGTVSKDQLASWMKPPAEGGRTAEDVIGPGTADMAKNDYPELKKDDDLSKRLSELDRERADKEREARDRREQEELAIKKRQRAAELAALQRGKKSPPPDLV